MIYFVEDDNSIRELVIYTLNSQGMESEGVARPSDFWAAMERQKPELILLDIMLPEEDGMSILRKLKCAPDTQRIPVIMLTAKGSEFDKVLGLDSGADDYIAKPFGMMELLARIRALMRRVSTETPKQTKGEYEIAGLHVSVERHIVEVDHVPVSLTLKEFELLCFLLERPDMVCTRAMLLDSIWGYDFCGESRTVDVHIRTLRQKLGPYGQLIETIRGIGYKIGGAAK